MDGWQFTAALASAFLHAAWNAGVKASAQPQQAMAAQMTGAALLGALALFWTGLPAPAALPWLALSTTMALLAVIALLKAYESGPFGTVYPTSRAVSVLGVALLSPLLTGEMPGIVALGGIGLIASALVMLALHARRAGAAGAFPLRAFGWTLAAGGITALYALVDAQGVRAAGSPAAYGCVASITNALAMGWRMRATGNPLALIRTHWCVALPAAVASMTSYVLILWVWAHAPVAPAAALRDTSAIFAMLIAVLFLKESLGAWRLLAVLLATAGVPLLRLG
jgi:drug/metabolite transporter (DMT)-like permease